MSNIVFFNIPTSGQTNPSLALVRELTRRQEQVDYYSVEKLRDPIELAGARFHQLPTTRDFGQRKTLLSYLIGTPLEVVPILLEQLQGDRPKLLVFGSKCLWGSLLGSLLKVPTVSIHTNFLLLPRFVPPLEVLLAAYPISKIPTELRILYKHRQLWVQLTQKYQEAQVKKDELFTLVPAVINLKGDLNIVCTSETFQIKREFFDKSYIFTGPCYGDRPEDPNFPLAKIEGKSVIYISLGTIFTNNIPFYQKCLQAFGYTPHEVVMSVGKSVDIELLGELPPNFIVRNYVPQLKVLKHTSVFITHGGTNSTWEALINGVPLVVFPQDGDHYLTAHRLQELGAGIWVKQKNMHPLKLRELVERVMKDSQIRHNVEQLGTSLKVAGGTHRAVDKILEFKQLFS